jgi:hypothetical protein
MAWVKTFSEQEAVGRVAEIYQEIMPHKVGGGGVPNVIKSMGLRPEAMLGVWRLATNMTFGASTLGRAREEMIATAVSALNRCHY